jgi:hypothetical protein
MDELSYPDEYFDIVVTSMALHETPPEVRQLLKLYKLLPEEFLIPSNSGELTSTSRFVSGYFSLLLQHERKRTPT